MLADQKAREAKYGTVTLASTTLADTSGPRPLRRRTGTASGRPRIYDASEGTALDPLLNKTYDLSYAKVVPARCNRKCGAASRFSGFRGEMRSCTSASAMAQAFETLRLLIAPGRSSRAR